MMQSYRAVLRTEYGHLGAVCSSQDIVRYEDLNTLWLPMVTISSKPVKNTEKKQSDAAPATPPKPAPVPGICTQLLQYYT